MITCVPVTADAQVGPHWGKATRLAIAEVAQGRIVSWQEFEVAWDSLHDSGTEGSHHARIVTFLREHAVARIVASGMGPGMQRVTAKLGIDVVLGAHGDARSAVLAAE